MKAKELKDKYLDEEKQDAVGVIAIKEDGNWWHIHENEEIPEDVTIALHPRKIERRVEDEGHN